MKTVAVIEIAFDQDKMIDTETLVEYFDGSLLKYMKSLYKDEGMGIFDGNAWSELVDIKAYKK